MRQGQPYFSGNYGSALGSTANAANLIARAGEVQGQMFANLGKQISSTLEKFRMNKEKKEGEQRAENQFLNLYEGNPENPIFKNLGIQSTDEAKAVAKDISKDPQLIQQAMQFAQAALAKQQADQTATMNAMNIAAKGQELANTQSKTDAYKQLFQPNAQGQVPAQQLFPQAKQFIQSIQGGKMNPEVAATLAASFQKRSDESGKSAGRTTIVDPATGKSQVVNLNNKGEPISVVGEAPSQPKRIRSPEEEEQINITTARNARGLKFADSIFDQAQSSLATKETAKEALGRLENIETGGLTEAKINFLKLANSMGVPLSADTLKEIGDTEAFMSATGNFLFDSIQKTKGSISDSEMKIFRSINPGIVQTKEGNRIMLNYFIAKADRDQRLADYVEELEIDDVSPREIQRKARAWLKDPENDLSNTLEGLKGDKASDSPKNKELINATPSGTKTLSPDLVQLKNQVLEKAKAGQPLTQDEQRVLDLLKKQSDRK
jgi:hypothetical protein